MSFSPLSKLGIIQNLNYIANSDFNNFPFASNATLGWSLKNGGTPDATTKLPTAAPSAAAAGTLTLTAVSGGSQISGTVSASLSSTAATTAGDMLITDALTLDLKAQSTIQSFSFSYKVSANGTGTPNFSGTSSNAIGVAIYDVTNAAWIQPAGVFNLVQSSGVGRSSGSFQVPSNCTSVRLAVYFPNSTAASGGSPFTVIFDDFVLGPQSTAQGAAISDWVSYTPTLSSSTGTITNCVPTGAYRRVGDSLEVSFQLRWTGAVGTWTGPFISIPSGLSIDTSKLPGTNDIASILLGQAGSLRVGLTNQPLFIRYVNTTVVSLTTPQTNGTYLGPDNLVASTIPVSWGSGDIIWGSFRVPISGFSSNTVLSQDTDTRVVAARISRAGSSQTISVNNSGDLIEFFSNSGGFQYDTHGAFATGTYQYRIPVSGVYSVNSNLAFSGTNTLLSRYFAYITRNGTPVLRGSEIIPSSAGSPFACSVNGSILCNAGDTISVFIFGVGNNSVNTLTLDGANEVSYFSIQRLSGPATIAASETVGCLYNTLAAGTVTGAGIDLIYLTREFDTHGAYSTSTGEYTVPVSGKYTINAAYRTQTTAMSITHGTTLYVRVDGVIVKFIQNLRTQTTTGILREIMGIPVTLNLNAGQKIKFGASSDTNAAIDTASLPTAFNWVSIMRTGN